MAVVLLALRLAVGFLAEPMGDEAYYWVWGQHPGWSYYDHPPLQAWVQGVTTAVLGPSLFALRLPSLLAFGGTLWVLALFMRRHSGPEWRAGVLVGLVVLLGSPLFMIYTTVVTPDYLLVMLSLSAVYLMARFLETADGDSPRWRFYFGAAVVVGLACLTKYIGAVLLVGFGLVALFIWLAENIGTFARAWTYPSQDNGWHMVGLEKLGSWYLLMIISFVLVSLVQRPRKPDASL